MIRSSALRTGSVALGLALAFLASTEIATTAPAAQLETVRVGRAIVNSYPFAMLEVGQDAHIWERAGLKLDVSSFKGDGQLQDGLVSGSVDIGFGSGPAMGYRAKGVPAIAVAAIYGAPANMAIVVAPNSGVKVLADLRGKKLGVSTSGSLTDWLVHETSREQGWGADGIESLAMGATSVRLAAMQSGDIAGTILDLGVGYELEEQKKGKVLQNFGFIKSFETHVIFSSDKLIASRPDIVERFLKGWFQTVAYAKTHKAATVKSTAPVLEESNAVLSRIYDAETPGLSANGVFDPQSVAAVAASLKELGITDTAPDPKTLYTTRFVPVKV